MDHKCPICDRPMIQKNINGQITYVCTEHSSMKNVLTNIAEQANQEFSQYFPKK